MHWMWTFSEEKHFPHPCPIKTAVAGKNCESPGHGSWITTQHPDSRSDYGVAGVFGAGKTRAAAAMIVGLLVIDPDLKLMVSTKENAAAQAFADHVLSFDLLEKINEKFGRLVGYLETKEGPSNQTRLDIQSQNRNNVIRQKAVLIGCGGGFRQEASQKYSPVGEWFQHVDLCLHDEAQLFGNLDEVSAVCNGVDRGSPADAERPEEDGSSGSGAILTEYFRPHALQKLFQRMAVCAHRADESWSGERASSLFGGGAKAVRM